jgi:hypothetical protein
LLAELKIADIAGVTKPPVSFPRKQGKNVHFPLSQAGTLLPQSLVRVAP